MPKFKGYTFGLQPASKLSKTIMSQPSPHYTTMEFGRVVPIKCQHVVPGDIISEKIAALIRMATPITALMNGVHGSFHAFFVPMRLLWDHTPEFYGENRTSAGPQTIPYTIPHIPVNANNADYTVQTGSVAHYLGYPLRKKAVASSLATRTMNVLPLRGYYAIINDYYRATQVMDPYIVSKADTATIGTHGGVNLKVSDACVKGLKNFDIFTTATISPTYGGETSLPLLGYAPIAVINDPYIPSSLQGTLTDVYFGKGGGSEQQGDATMLANTDATSKLGAVIQGPGSPSMNDFVQLKAGSATGRNFSTNIVIDLSQATATKLNDLYLAMAVERWKWHANYGQRMFERLEVSYGVRNPDLVLNRPEHLGEFHFDISIQTVLATADTKSGGTGASLGQPGANSATFVKCNLFNHSFGEYGYLYILMNTYLDQVYSAGADKMFLEKDVLDLYWPEFVNKGDEKLPLDTLYYDESQDNAKTAFGYIEAFGWERWTKSRVSGLLDPYVDSSINSSYNGIKGFVAAQKFSTAPSLDADFLREDRTPMTDVLTTGSSSPLSDFVCAFQFDTKVTRSITPRSVPGIPTRLW